jgi:hypothetical protein
LPKRPLLFSEAGKAGFVAASGERGTSHIVILYIDQCLKPSKSHQKATTHWNIIKKQSVPCPRSPSNAFSLTIHYAGVY